jgi:hypothetical protein
MQQKAGCESLRLDCDADENTDHSSERTIEKEQNQTGQIVCTWSRLHVESVHICKCNRFRVFRVGRISLTYITSNAAFVRQTETISKCLSCSGDIDPIDVGVGSLETKRV